MTFYRVHLDRGRNAFWAMEEESEELYETAQVLLDPETGSFTDEVSERLEYVGSALLVMDRVTLDPPWRGHGLAAVLACEAITRLMAGCRAVACSPGITDLSSQRLTEKAEWDRVNARIAQGRERLGFRPYRDNTYLLSAASQDLEEQRGALRRHLADLGASWRTDAS
jgi:GNAT superfamily N-acetyltransferase